MITKHCSRCNKPVMQIQEGAAKMLPGTEMICRECDELLRKKMSGLTSKVSLMIKAEELRSRGKSRQNPFDYADDLFSSVFGRK